MGRKHCGKRRNCLLRAISPFPTVFSKGLIPRGIKRCHCVGMGYIMVTSLRAIRIREQLYYFCLVNKICELYLAVKDFVIMEMGYPYTTLCLVLTTLKKKPSKNFSRKGENANNQRFFLYSQ